MSGFSNNDSSMGGGGYGACAGYSYSSSNYGSSGGYGAMNSYDRDPELSPDSDTPEFMGMQRGANVGFLSAAYPPSSSFATTDFDAHQIQKSQFNEKSATSLSFSNPQEFRLAAEKAHPFIVTHSNLTFDQIPSVTGVPIRRQFFAPRKYLSPSNFETLKKWEGVDGIESTIKDYFEKNGYPYCLPDTIAVFSVSGISSDRNLIFDIHCCPTQDGEKFVIEFRRVRGDAFILSKIFMELKSLLVPAGQEEEEAAADEEDVALGSSMQYDIPPVERSRYNGEYFNFDALIK